MLNRPEILAPAGGPEALEAALRSGADAVYLGGHAFNARRSAAGFDDAALDQAVRDCHLRGVRAYLTLNTIVYDGELQAAADFLYQAACLGVDAVIVQDMGIARLAREIAPGLRLHASTQMTVHSPAGVRLLRDWGFSRVVLAREMTAREVAEAAQTPGIETELFVHGALCMSVSGQCYFSSVLGCRSGNRGLCAQPCRLPFSAEEGGADRTDLSLKDLSLMPRLREAAALGVSSLKIEGRMKRPEYVAAAVQACRAALDGGDPDMDMLGAVFSRSGFTDGYFADRRGREMFGARRKEDVVRAAPVLGKIRSSYKDEPQRVPVRFSFAMQPDQPCTLAVADEDGNRAQVSGALPQPALHRATDRELVERNLCKTGGTPFFAARIDCALGEGLMVPASSLNALRRDALEQLAQARIAPRPADVRRVRVKLPEAAAYEGKPRLRAQFARVSQVPLDALEDLEQLWLPLDEILRHRERLRQVDEKLVAALPRGMFGREKQLAAQLAQAKAAGIRSVVCPTIGAVQLAREAGLVPIGGWPLNLANSLSLEALYALGVQEAVVSFELTKERALELRSAVSCGFLAYGRQPLMLTRNCPVRNVKSCAQCGGKSWLTDRKGIRFPVVCDGGCSEVLNAVPLFLADRMHAFRGMRFALLLFTVEQPDECRRVLEMYAGRRPPEKTGRLTNGLYWREVL